MEGGVDCSRTTAEEGGTLCAYNSTPAADLAGRPPLRRRAPRGRDSRPPRPPPYPARPPPPAYPPPSGALCRSMAEVAATASSSTRLGGALGRGQQPP
jgi:hypothetical protein